MILHCEVGVERTQCQSPVWAECCRHPSGHSGILTVGGHHSERSLAQADHCVELFVKSEHAGIPTLERRAVRGVRLRDLDEPLADVDAVYADPAACQFMGMPSGTAPHVEYVIARPKPEHFDDVIDLLHRSLRVRVPVVRRPHMLCQRLEPVLGHLGIRPSE